MRCTWWRAIRRVTRPENFAGTRFLHDFVDGAEPGFLLTVMAAVFIGGTSIFGGKATIVGSYLGAYIIGMIEAGLVATGMQGFWVRAVVGLVFLAAVVFHLTMDQPQRLARLRQVVRLGGRFQRRPAPQTHEPR
jgi:branched-subunit amino acid ABC-type transport system permease component